MLKVLNRIFPKYLLIFLFLLLLPSFPYNLLVAQSEKANDVFRVMTYNIRFAGNEEIDGVNAWSKRKKLVASMISFHHADIIGLQEALLIQLHDLSEMLPGYSWVGVGRDDGIMHGEFSAIFYRNNRFEVIKDSTFWLSETPNIPSLGWDAMYPRIVTWAEFRDTQTGKTFFIFNTHFDHIGITAKKSSSMLIKQKIANIVDDQPIILTGDFNTQDSTEAYNVLVSGSENEKHKFFDAQFISKTGHHGSNVTFNGFGKSIVHSNKIDFIFVTEELLIIQHGVVDEIVDGHYPSDHMPVVAEMVIK